MKIRALSLWQPWASLMALNAKQYETRHWSTTYRGPLVIHAARRWEDDQLAIFRQPDFAAALKETAFASIFKTVLDLPFGCVVAVGYLSAVYDTRAALDHHLISDRERAFGDYGPGRFAWQITHLKPVPLPVPLRGHQRLWDPTRALDTETVEFIKEWLQNSPS